MRRIIWIIALLGLSSGLFGFTVVGHRGAPLLAPEQTIESFKQAIAIGASTVELDLQESADGQLMVTHDPNLLRMTGVPLPVASATAATIHQYHTKNGEPIHTLAEVLAALAPTRSRFLIETKIEKGVPHPAMELKLANLIRAYHLEKRVMVHSFNLKSLKRFKKLMPKVKTLLIVGKVRRIDFATLDQVDGINVRGDLLTVARINALHALGKLVYVWNQMDEDPPSWTTLTNYNIDGIVTNDISLALTYANAKRSSRRHRASDALINYGPAQAVYPNPYVASGAKRQVAPLEVIQPQAAMTTALGQFYQLGVNAYVSGATFLPLHQQHVGQLFFDQHVQVATTKLTLPLKNAPTKTGFTTRQVPNHTPLTIIGIHQAGAKLWFQTESGWLPANCTQIRPQNTSWFHNYLRLPARTRPQLSWQLANVPNILDIIRIL